MKLYVPNPQLWVDYFDRVSKGTSNQRGGGRRPRIIMVKPSLKKEKDLHVSINAVLPTEQAAAQAKSELEREDINPKDVEKMFHKLSERRRDSTKKRKRKRPSSSTISKRQKREGKRGSTGKRKSSTKRHPDIFEIE